MKNKFNSLSVFEFQERFPTEAHCLAYLAELKWSTGYTCVRCGHHHYCNAVRPHDRQCTACNHIESPMAGTLFHLCKFSILKAFWIIYYLSTTKKGMSSMELSRKLSLRQKTCWLFKQKVMKAMESRQTAPMMGVVEVDETYVGGQDTKAVGRNEGNKKIVVIAIEKKGRGVSRIYGRVIDQASKKNLKSFMTAHIDQEAKIRTDGWAGYKGLNSVFPNLKQEISTKKGGNFRDLHRVVMLFKAWLRGMHHSVDYLQAYVNEYTYRFNRHLMQTGLFENLVGRMMSSRPHTYKMIIA